MSLRPAAVVAAPLPLPPPPSSACSREVTADLWAAVSRCCSAPERPDGTTTDRHILTATTHRHTPLRRPPAHASGIQNSLPPSPEPTMAVSVTGRLAVLGSDRPQRQRLGAAAASALTAAAADLQVSRPTIDDITDTAAVPARHPASSPLRETDGSVIPVSRAIVRSVLVYYWFVAMVVMPAHTNMHIFLHVLLAEVTRAATGLCLCLH